jgi:hypothetical protein
MADIATELAGKCGISLDAARKGLGAVLGFFKSKLPTESFAKVSEAVPGADTMMAAAADTQKQASGGVIGAVKGAIGKVFGGGDASALLARLGNTGMTPEQVQGFIPNVKDALQNRLPDNVMSQVTGLLPIPK